MRYRFTGSSDSGRRRHVAIGIHAGRVVPTEAPRRRIVPLLLCVVLCTILFAGCGRGSQGAADGLKKITFNVSPLLGSAAIYVAHEKGYFEDEGLDVALERYASGQSSLQAVLSGNGEFSAVAETPIAYAAVRGKALAVVATIAKIERASLIVARKDRSISQAADLKGKKIGAVPGTTADFFLHVYLTTSYIDPKEVHLVDLRSEAIVPALLAGDVDAVSTWSPLTIALQDKLGDNAVILDEPGLYALTWNLVVTRDLLRLDPDAIVRVLRAIIRANRFITEQPDEARAVTARNIGADIAAVARQWADTKPTAVLDQDLILDLEDQARWILKREAVVGQQIPNFLDFIDTSALRTVAPDAVRIVERQK